MRGGTEPTVTDSDITLGYIVPDTFAEGHIKLDPEGSKQSLSRVIGSKLDLDAVGSADGVSRIVDESMASAGRMHAVESGKDLGLRTMIAFGGNGPLHASRVARSAGVSRIVIPPNPGVGSAVGFLFAPVSFEIVRSRYSLLDSMDMDEINALFDDHDRPRPKAWLPKARAMPRPKHSAPPSCATTVRVTRSRSLCPTGI